MLVLTTYSLQVFKANKNFRIRVGVITKEKESASLDASVACDSCDMGIILSLLNLTRDVQLIIPIFARSKEINMQKKWGTERCNTYFMSNFTRMMSNSYCFKAVYLTVASCETRKDTDTAYMLFCTDLSNLMQLGRVEPVK